MLLMTMADVARLAGVRRQVVTVWRSRPRVNGRRMPFPEPVDDVAGVARFDADAVVTWLEETGRGNNPQARLDVAAHVRPPVAAAGSAGEPVAALICLAHLIGVTLADLGQDDLLDLADETDPDDRFLFTEVRGLGADVVEVAAYVDELVEAAYGADGAFDAHRRRADTGHVLHRSVRDLVGRLGAALVRRADMLEVAIDDATPSSGLVAAVHDALGEGLDVDVVVRDEATDARAARRAHLIHGRRLTRPHGDGEAVLTVAHLAPRAAGGEGAAELLDVLDDVQLRLGSDQRGLVLGPAALLCDRLDDREQGRLRDDALRSGAVRAVVRLPAGLDPARPRQALGLWVFGRDPDDLRPGERILAVADLSNERLTDPVIDDLVTDLVSVVTGPRAARAHTFRFAQVVLAATLLAEDEDLVPRGADPSRSRVVRPAEQLLRLEELTASLALDEAIRAETGGEQPLTGTLSVQEALSSGALRLVAGNRVDMALADPAGTVRLLTVDDLGSETPSLLHVDPVALETAYPRARRTEPGDIVFTVVPAPRAEVDHDGLSVVVSPARVLRCRPGSGMVPGAVARAINSMPDDRKQWRSWRVPRVPASQETTLSHALQTISTRRAELLRALTNLDELADLLVDGLATRALTLTTKGS